MLMTSSWISKTVLTVVVAVTGWAVAGGAASAGDPRDLAELAKVDFATAVRTAQAHRAGHVVEAALEREAVGSHEELLVWSFDVLTPTGLVEVLVDAVGGGIVATGEDDEDEDEEEDEDGEEDEDEEDDDDDDGEYDEEDGESRREAAAFRRVLRHSEKSLVELAGAVGAVVHGRVVAAEFEIDDGQPVAEFLIANGRYLIEVAAEARAGHLVEIELVDDLRSRHEDDDEDEEEHEDERDEDDDDDDDDDDAEDGDDEDDEREEGRGSVRWPGARRDR